MIDKDEFINTAEGVCGAYEDFALGTYIESKSIERINEVYYFMRHTKGVTTDDVCEFLNNLEGKREPYSVDVRSKFQAV